MSGLCMLEPTELFNLLNQETLYPRLSDPSFMLLLDARELDDYNEGHIITAKRATKSDGEFSIPFDADLECKAHVIVYDSRTSTTSETSPALSCARKMWEMGSRNSVQVLKGGYEAFSALYPFLRTQKILLMPQELDEIQTYPSEILQHQLYLGNWLHGNTETIQKELGIGGHINCCERPGTIYAQEGSSLLHLVSSDVPDAHLFGRFEEAVAFINVHRRAGRAVLVFSQLGISRAATVTIAFLMKENGLTLSDAHNWVVQCRPHVRPNRGFMSQLSQWEALLNSNKAEGVAESVTNINAD